MPGRAVEWPAWPEFVFDKAVEGENKKDIDYRVAKKAIVEEYGESSLREGWLKTCAELEKVTDEIDAKGRTIIPILTMKDVEAGLVSSEQRDELSRVGCFVVRGVIDPAVATEIFQDL